MTHSEVCLIINVCVTLYAAFSIFLWFINVPDDSVNTAAACCLIIRRRNIISQDDWFGHVLPFAVLVFVKTVKCKLWYRSQKFWDVICILISFPLLLIYGCFNLLVEKVLSCELQWTLPCKPSPTDISGVAWQRLSIFAKDTLISFFKKKKKRKKRKKAQWRPSSLNSCCGCLNTEYIVFLTKHQEEHHSPILQPTSLPRRFQRNCKRSRLRRQKIESTKENYSQLQL